MPVSERAIAIVEDDPGVRRAIRRLLRAAGFEARLFASADRFLASPAPEPHGCRGLDIRLPGMSGPDLRRALDAAGARLPTVFVTAHDDRSVREAARRLDNSVYLVKPFPGPALIAAVDAALGRAGGARRDGDGGAGVGGQ